MWNAGKARSLRRRPQRRKYRRCSTLGTPVPVIPAKADPTNTVIPAKAGIQPMPSFPRRRIQPMPSFPRRRIQPMPSFPRRRIHLMPSFPRRRNPTNAVIPAKAESIRCRHSREGGNPGLTFRSTRPFRHGWIPAFAGMTRSIGSSLRQNWIPAFAGMTRSTRGDDDIAAWLDPRFRGDDEIDRVVVASELDPRFRGDDEIDRGHDDIRRTPTPRPSSSPARGRPKSCGACRRRRTRRSSSSRDIHRPPPASSCSPTGRRDRHRSR